VATNSEEALRRCRKAGGQGYSAATKKLATHYYFGQGGTTNYVEAVKWLRRAANPLNVEAQYNLAYCYANGLGVATNYGEAVRLCRDAARRNHAKAQLLLGSLYEAGPGTKPDYGAAVEWYRQAAEQNNAEAQYKLSLCYWKGQGVPKDLAAAYQWCYLAASLGEERARTNLPQWKPLLTNEQLDEALGFIREFQQVTTPGADQSPAQQAATSSAISANPHLKAGEVEQEKGSGKPSIDLVFISPGTFLMGHGTNELGTNTSRSTQTKVQISRGFWIGKYEVTQGEYRFLMHTNPSRFLGNGRRPVERVSWEDARLYCEALTQHDRAAGRIPTNYLYRLPTEAEWEYACRAGTTTQFSYGNAQVRFTRLSVGNQRVTINQISFVSDEDYSKLAQYAWYPGNSEAKTHPVGQKLPNPWGLYDMHGNVYEWCAAGPMHPDEQGVVVDPGWPPGKDSTVVIRGGCWGDFMQKTAGPAACWSANRFGVSSGLKFDQLGFRVVLSVEQP